LATAITALLVSAVALCVVLAVRVDRLRRLFGADPTAVEFDRVAQGIVAAAADRGHVRIIAVKPGPETTGSVQQGARTPLASPHAIFLEVTRGRGPCDRLLVRGECSYGYQILKVEAAKPGLAIASVLLGVHDLTGMTSRVDFSWPEGSHAGNLLRFLLFGTGNVAGVTREILHRNISGPLRPRVHVS